MTSEKQILHAILSTFGSLPWMRLMRCNAGKAYTTGGKWIELAPAGAADLNGWLCIPSAAHSAGRRIEIEVKSARGTMRLQQQRYRVACLAGGVLHIVARSVDDVWTALEREGYPTR